MSDPTSVFYSAVAALKAKAWERAAELCDPVSLSLFKRDLLSRIHAKPHQWSVEQLLRYQPELPREIAEFQVARLNRQADPVQTLIDEVPSIPSMEALESMPPIGVFAAWLEGQSHERQVERAARESSVPAEVLAEALLNPLETDYVVLGVVGDGDRLAHVAFRREYGLPDDSEESNDSSAADLSEDERSVMKDMQAFLEFSTLRRQPDGRWCLIAGHGFLGRNNPVFAFGSDDQAESGTG